MKAARSPNCRTEIRVLAGTLLFACAMLLTPLAGAADEPAFLPVSTGDSSSRPGEASIPFANHGGIFDWRSDGTRGIWVQASNRKWYYGTFMTACLGLEATDRVGFVTNPSGDFDHWSSIVVRHEFLPCHLASFTTSEAPPDHRRDTASAAASDAARSEG